MTTTIRTASQDTADSLRKRVCKACDRCRLKKSKCDGSNPCSRCRADNAICVFGERKKSHDKVYPKGYVEMLEQQQSQLVAGLQDSYTRLKTASAWPGAPLSEIDGQPLTHDILTRLNIISNKGDDDLEPFEEDCERLQERLVSQGAPYLPRRSSPDFDSEPVHNHKRPRPNTETPMSSPPKPIFRKSFDFDRTRTSSPVHRRSPSLQSSQPSQHNAMKPSPLHNESPVETPPVEDSIPPVEVNNLWSTWDYANASGSNFNPDFVPQFTFNPAGFPPQMQMQSAFDSWTGFEPHHVQFDTSLMGNFTNQTPESGPAVKQDWQNGTAQEQQQQVRPHAQQQQQEQHHHHHHHHQQQDMDFAKFVRVAT